MGQPVQEVEPDSVWEVGSDRQAALIACPFNEPFFGGSRGGGKTEGCLGDWFVHAREYEADARGVFFRHTLPQLEQVIERAEQLFPPPVAKYNAQKKTFTFWNGALLKFRYLDSMKDADNYQGHEYSRIYFEEITNWSDPGPIDKLRACLRSTNPGIIPKMISTGNPGGIGHNWVKDRYIDPDPRGFKPITESFSYTDPTSGETDTVEMTRVYIPSRLEDNAALQNKALYVAQLHQVGSPELVRAWLEGDWDIIAGAYLSGIWDASRHVVDPFKIPLHWKRWRSMDWGTYRPYAIQYFAKSPEGIIYVTDELYGWGDKPNHGTGETADLVAERMVEYEREMLRDGVTFRNSPADSSIWANTGSEKSVEAHFRDKGIAWVKADKAPGSRINGAHEIVTLLHQDRLKVFSTCYHTIRTLPVLPRDEKHLDDVDTDAEDHCWDALRYGVVRRQKKTKPAGKAQPTVVVNLDNMRHQPGDTTRYKLRGRHG
jgi:hypothetical protein